VLRKSIQQRRRKHVACDSAERVQVKELHRHPLHMRRIGVHLSVQAASPPACRPSARPALSGSGRVRDKAITEARQNSPIGRATRE
jgi:hypothetical protein